MTESIDFIGLNLVVANEARGFNNQNELLKKQLRLTAPPIGIKRN